jgi:hypothetical protein
VERMLGTALVLASLDKGYLLCKSSLQILVQRASAAPWVTRPDRCASASARKPNRGIEATKRVVWSVVGHSGRLEGKLSLSRVCGAGTSRGTWARSRR